MKIAYTSFGSHFEIAIEPVLEALLERGHKIIKYDPSCQGQENILKKIDIMLLTSNAGRPIIKDKHIKTFFIPHGIGMETWELPMNYDNKVFLAGKKPWIPPPMINNWEIVGSPKTDALFNPRQERVEYAKNLVASLPYEQSILCIPVANDYGIAEIHFLVDYFERRKINMIVPFRESITRAKKYYKKYNHIAMPKIQNLYYFAPYIKVIICVGYTCVGREFYITKIPAMHLYQGFPESKMILPTPDVDIEHFDPLFSQIWDNSEAFLQPESVAKEFIGINDGKVVERIVKEVEK